MLVTKKTTLESEDNSSLFQKFVLTTGLSPIFAENSMKRACKRVGVDPDKFSKADVYKVALEFERILSLYLPPEEVKQKLELLQSLGK